MSAATAAAASAAAGTLAEFGLRGQINNDFLSRFSEFIL